MRGHPAWAFLHSLMHSCMLSFNICHSPGSGTFSPGYFPVGSPVFAVLATLIHEWCDTTRQSSMHLCHDAARRCESQTSAVRAATAATNARFLHTPDSD